MSKRNEWEKGTLLEGLNEEVVDLGIGWRAQIAWVDIRSEIVIAAVLERTSSPGSLWSISVDTAANGRACDSNGLSFGVHFSKPPHTTDQCLQRNNNKSPKHVLIEGPKSCILFCSFFWSAFFLYFHETTYQMLSLYAVDESGKSREQILGSPKSDLALIGRWINRLQKEVTRRDLRGDGLTSNSPSKEETSNLPIPKSWEQDC